MTEVCWNYTPGFCARKCSYPESNCSWIKDAQYNKGYVPPSPTKEISENKLENKID